MSSINVNNIDINYPIQGQDNNSQGFRSNFNAIRTALTVAKSEITSLETDTVKRNLDNNLNGNKLENVVFNNSSDLFKNKGQPIEQLIELDVEDAKVFKVKCIGDTTIRLTNWPQNQPAVQKSHSIKLHLYFDISPTDPELLNYKVNFSTDIQEAIKSYSQGTPWTYNDNLGGWHLKAWRDTNISSDYSRYEHVFDIWSYQGGQVVFIKYLGSFA